MALFRLIAFCLTLICVGVNPAAAQEKRYALLIGNQAYDASVGVLKNPHNDVTLVAQSLEKQGFEILPLVKDAKRSAILGAVRDLANRLRIAGSGAVGFLYYSGHGAAEKDTNINYLIPVDAKDPGTTAFWDDSIKLDDIMRLLDGARGSVKFVVFDACRNELQLPTRDTSKGLLPVAEQQGFFVAYASAPGRTASDRGETSGPYAAALVKEMAKQGLDHLNLFQNVKETVIASTGGSQHPWESNGLTRRVYLTGEPTMPAEIALWDTVKGKDDIAALEAFLRRFPDGVFANTARSSIERLQREAAHRQALAKEEEERKAREQKQVDELKQALDEARKAREALAQAERLRTAAATREEDLRRAQAALQSAPANSGRSPSGSAELAQALAAAEAKRRESEERVAALEKAERDRREALEILRKRDEAAAKRADADLEIIRKAQEEFLRRREIRFGQFMSVNDNCQPQPPPAIDIVKNPVFGTVQIRNAEVELTSVVSKRRERCLGMKLPGRSAVYILDEQHQDRTDIDTIQVRVRHVGGVVDTIEYAVDLKERVSTRRSFSRKQ